MNKSIFLTETIRKALKLHPLYIVERNRMRRSDVNAELLVEKAVRRAVRDVPFYKDYNKYLRGDFDIKRFPILRKTDILGNSPLLISRKAFRPMLKRKETGGSTGISLELFYSPSTIIRKEAVVDLGFAYIGKHLRKAVLRGNVPSGGKLFEKVGDGTILLSSYLLCSDTLETYLDVLRSERISCIHVYPSALTVLARLIEAKYGTAPNLPHLRGFFSSSEIFPAQEKELVKRVFPGVKIVDMYGHNELACAALSFDGAPFKFYSSFGFVELIPNGEVVNGRRVAEIVATSVLNRSMPFIRYGTDDYVLLDDQDRPIEILGRTSDHVYDLKGELCPCMVNTRNESFAHVTNFQYYQPEVGTLVMRVVPSEGFTEADRRLILEDMQNSFHQRLRCDVAVVDDVDRTPIGKQIRLVQCVKR